MIQPAALFGAVVVGIGVGNLYLYTHARQAAIRRERIVASWREDRGACDVHG